VLSAYRVIDMTNEEGLLCGQILADLGADVIQVEPPGGCRARSFGPWQQDESGPERSLFWWAYARNKRSIVLDIETAAGRDELIRLVRGADFLIESESPGRLAALGLDYDELVAVNPALVYVSISPFGQTGPKAGWAATDLTQVAAGGQAYLSGDEDRPPLRVRVPQAHAHAGSDAAVAALIAHFERKRTGHGQHVDISQQQSVTLATMFRSLDTPLDEVPARRLSGGVLVKGIFIPLRYPLRDGWVVLGPALLPSTGHFMTRLVQWMAEEGFCDAALADENWGSYALRLIIGEISEETYRGLDELLGRFFVTRSRDEMMKAVIERRLLMAPIIGLDEIIDGEQLASRDFNRKIARKGGGSVRYPGPFAKFSASPIRYERAAPLIDEHGAEIRAEPERTPAPTGSEPTGMRPLDGVKILDLFWILAGPGSTRMLADYGATVVHVESMRRLDTLRVIPPYQFSNPHPEGAGAYQSANANKLGLTLNLQEQPGLDIVMDLVRWADVVTESFAPGVIEEAGLGYEKLRSVNPDVIMISSCLMGQTGPWRDFTGFGNLAASVTGYQTLASWPGRPPAGPYGAYTDFIAVRYNALAILAALEHRDRTGEGQRIDQAQAEAALHFITPAFLDYTVNGRVPEPSGNSDGEFHPHDFYRAAGEDRWVAIVVQDEEGWRALCEVIGRPDLVSRRGEREAVDAAISEWTCEREPNAIEEALQARGIAAHTALDTPGLFSDEQLQHRGHYHEIGHDIYQTTTIESTRLKLSRNSPKVPENALSFGRDNRYVLEEILGYSPERIAQLAAWGILN
jgi:crotonobetainyl-CoA:carnitine CoA-transferase CaiB-like acyl-CoA transferase